MNTCQIEITKRCFESVHGGIYLFANNQSQITVDNTNSIKQLKNSTTKWTIQDLVELILNLADIHIEAKKDESQVLRRMGCSSVSVLLMR